MPHLETQATDAVDKESEAYKASLEDWQLITALHGGTKGMRDEQERYLPREPKEPWTRYRVRLERSFLYEAAKDAIDRIVAKPFSRDITLNGPLSEPLTFLEDDADRSGADLTVFGRRLFRDAVMMGRSYFLVEFPRTGGRQIASDEAAGVIRPWFVHIPALQMIGIREERLPTGASRLTQIRWRESKLEASGDYGDEMVRYVRVMTAPSVMPASEDGPEERRSGTVEVWRKAEKDKHFVMVDAWNHTFPGIPLVRLRLGEEPPFKSLAWLNLEHWQKSSDYSHTLHHTLVPIRYLSGVGENEVKGGFEISAGKTYAFLDPQARIHYAEPGGGGLTAGRESLQDLEARMEVLSHQPLVKRSGNVTATEKAIDSGKSDSDAQSWARSLEHALTEGYRMAATWVRQKLSDEFAVDVWNDFGLTDSAEADADLLVRMTQTNLLPLKDLYAELRRRNKLRQSFDADAAIEELEAAGPPLAMVGMGGQTEADDVDMEGVSRQDGG